MSYLCDVCKNNTKGWVKTSYKSSTFIYCSYECYQKMPSIIPCQSVYKSSEQENTDPIILPHRYKPANTFEILTETEINQLTNEEYKNYKVELDEHFLLNPINSQVYHETTTYDKKVKEMEDEFNDSSSDNEIMDDY